jgi:YVTN family beta-propeller protein
MKTALRALATMVVLGACSCVLAAIITITTTASSGVGGVNAPGDHANTEPLLGRLQGNNRPTLTHIKVAVETQGPAPTASPTPCGVFAYVPNQFSNTVSVIDTSNNTILTIVAVGGSPFGVAVNPAGSRAYVTNLDNASVSVIDTLNNAVVTTVPVGFIPEGVAINPAGTRAYVANNGPGSISVINTSNNTVLTTITVGADPVGVAVNPILPRAYVANFGTNDLSIIDTSSNTVLTNIGVGSRPQGVAVNPAGTRAYVGNWSSNTVSVIDTSTNTVLTTIVVGTAPQGLAVTPDGTRAYVTNSQGNSVSVIDTSSNTVLTTVAVGNIPFGVAINPAGTRAYVANSGGNSVSVIDTTSNTVLTTAPVGNAPRGFGNFIGAVGGCSVPTPTPTATPTPTVAPTPTPTATPCAPIGSWTAQTLYPIAVSGNAIASQGGNVYSFGGIANNTAITNAYKYTPATNSWTPITPLPAPRGWFSGVSDGTYIYLLGGVDQNFSTTATLWRYDPATNSYNTSLLSYTIPTYFHASAYLNGKIYRIAGRAIGTDYHVEVYDVAANTWSMAANYPFANHSLMAVALGSYIYAGGGNASPDKTYRYDPGTNTWDDAAIADLPAGRSASASGAYNGRWLLAGGDVNFAVSSSAIAWDHVTNTWTDLPNMVQARDYLQGATAGQSFYAVAGNSGPGTPTNDNQQYTEIPCVTAAASRMTHGAVGDFDIDLPLGGAPGIETRTRGGTNDYTMVVTFSANVVVTGSPQAQVTLGTATIGSNGIGNGGMVTVSGNVVTIPLTNVANAQTINIRLNGVTGADAPAVDVTIPMSMLIGDVNASGVVNATDVVLTKAQLAQPVTTSNFRADVNASGNINASDVSLVKSHLGMQRPSAPSISMEID